MRRRLAYGLGLTAILGTLCLPVIALPTASPPRALEGPIEVARVPVQASGEVVVTLEPSGAVRVSVPARSGRVEVVVTPSGDDDGGAAPSDPTEATVREILAKINPSYRPVFARMVFQVGCETLPLLDRGQLPDGDSAADYWQSEGERVLRELGATSQPRYDWSPTYPILAELTALLDGRSPRDASRTLGRLLLILDGAAS